MGEYLFSGQITAKDANIGNAIARRRKPRSLFLNSPNVPFFFMLIKPEQNCRCTRCARTRPHNAPQARRQQVHVGLVSSGEVGFKRNEVSLGRCGHWFPASCTPFFTLSFRPFYPVTISEKSAIEENPVSTRAIRASRF